MAQKIAFGDDAALLRPELPTNRFGRIRLNAAAPGRMVKARRNIIAVPLAAIASASPFQTRRAFDPAQYPEDQVLVDSLAALGQREAVCLTEVDDKQYQIVYGHRRIAGYCGDLPVLGNCSRRHYSSRDRTHFTDRDLVPSVQSQESPGHTNTIIEIALGF